MSIPYNKIKARENAPEPRAAARPRGCLLRPPPSHLKGELSWLRSARTSRLKVENGTTDAGAVKYATRTFSSINPEISDEDLLAVGQGLAALQSHDVGDIQRAENATLVTA